MNVFATGLVALEDMAVVVCVCSTFGMDGQFPFDSNGVVFLDCAGNDAFHHGGFHCSGVLVCFLICFLLAQRNFFLVDFFFLEGAGFLPAKPQGRH